MWAVSQGSEDCSYPLFGTLCASINNTVRAAASTEDCMVAIPEGFREFFSKIMTVEGVIACVSYCHPLSPFFFECNGGECSIARNKGPQCSCPSSDYYLYATTHCTEPVSKIGLGTGISAGSIVVLIAIYYFVKIKYY
ncbi:mucin-12-like [Hyperolius riggenbachi]|uniref:mucin-12-like n=1 Tax=Hyperolius riggenbachi TaxID=752182 RepID=UPI0035A2FA73